MHRHRAPRRRLAREEGSAGDVRFFLEEYGCVRVRQSRMNVDLDRVGGMVSVSTLVKEV